MRPPVTLGLDPGCLAQRLEAFAERHEDGVRNRETGRRIAAVVCMHVFGHPVDMPPLVELCKVWGPTVD